MKPSQIFQSRFAPLTFSCVILFAISLAPSDCAAQLTGGNADETQGSAAATGGPIFEGGEVDLSVFEIERGGAIGSSEDTGFGLDSSDGGGAAGGGIGGGFGGGGLGGLGGGLGGLGGLFGGLGGAFGGQQGTVTRPIIRVRLRSAIAAPPLDPVNVQTAATRSLTAIPNRPEINGVNVTMDGRTAILSGTVTSEKDRRMSEMLIRLEPGVSRIENQIVVEQ